MTPVVGSSITGNAGYSGAATSNLTAIGPSAAYVNSHATAYGHFSQLADANLAITWNLVINCTSTSKPTVRSINYYFIDSEESEADGAFEGTTGSAFALATTPLTISYDYETATTSYIPYPDPDDASTVYSYSGGDPGYTWTNTSGNTWIGTYTMIAGTDFKTHAHGEIDRDYQGSSSFEDDGYTSAMFANSGSGFGIAVSFT